MRKTQMNNVVTLKDCAEILKNRDNILILCHRSPDGDTIGSAFALLYALQKMGKKNTVYMKLSSHKLLHNYLYFGLQHKKDVHNYSVGL